MKVQPPAQLRPVAETDEQRVARLVAAEVRKQLNDAIQHDAGYHRAAWQFGIGGLLIGAAAVAAVAGSLVFSGSIAATNTSKEILAIERMQAMNDELRGER